MKKLTLVTLAVGLIALASGCSKQAAAGVQNLTLGSGTNNIPIMVPVQEITAVTNQTQRPAMLQVVNDAKHGTTTAHVTSTDTRAGETFK